MQISSSHVLQYMSSFCPLCFGHSSGGRGGAAASAPPSFSSSIVRTACERIAFMRPWAAWQVVHR